MRQGASLRARRLQMSAFRFTTTAGRGLRALPMENKKGTLSGAFVKSKLAEN